MSLTNRTLKKEYKLKVWAFEILEAKLILEYEECIFIRLKLISKLKTNTYTKW